MSSSTAQVWETDDWKDPPPLSDIDNDSYNRKSRPYRKNQTRCYQGANRRTTKENERFGSFTTITVSSSKVGKIIGKQGMKIKELQSTTGTKIYIGRRNFEGEVNIKIYGASEDQEKCRKLVEEIVDPNKPTLLETLLAEAEAMGVQEKQVPVIDWETANRISDELEKVRWDRCPPLKKNFYIEDPEVAKMSEKCVARLRHSLNNITVDHVFGGTKKIPNPVKTFRQAFNHYPEIMSEIEKQGFENPFPIQCQAWPILLSGMDMIGIAQTGTGKTLAFLLPALIHIDGQEVPLSERLGPNVLVLAPTRELALQIDREVQKYSYRNIKSVCIYGGGNRRDQIEEVEKGVQIVIATPGRLNDLVMAGAIDLISVTFLILDEADRMLDLGFEPQIRKLLLHVRPDRQTVMTSATWPYTVQYLAEKYMNEPVQVVIGSLDLTAVHTVKQTVLVITEEEKIDYLMDLVTNMKEEDKVIIFVDRKSMADALSCDLVLQKIDCQSIHGNREQADREQAIEEIQSGVVRILIATDVASRGIDIMDVTKVINYDFPRNIEEYVHRVGRTGRAGKTGEAITFFTRNDWVYASELIPILEEANQVVPEELYDMKEGYLQAQQRKKTWKNKSGGGKPNSNSGNRNFGKFHRGGGGGY